MTALNNPPILITGAALATALGTDRTQTWQAVLAGKCGIGPLPALESPLPPGRDGGQAMDLPPSFEPDQPREVRYLKWTVRDALADAGIADPLPYDPGRSALLLGTTLHGMRAGGQFLRTGDFGKLQDFSSGATNKLLGSYLKFRGPALTVCSACSSSLGSIALAVTLLQNHQVDLVIAGGYDTISEYAYGGFNSLRLVADGALRPFSKNRQGMKLAEGYGIVVLERAADAQQRGRAGLVQILGWGESADAHHLTQPHPQGDGAARAISAALSRAGLQPGGIDLIAAHATGTPDNDAGEFAAMSRVFGDELPRIPVVGFKSHLGHTLGGAGAVELILSSMAIREQTVPACANITADDIEFAGLNVAVGQPKPANIRATLNTSLGFGGANTCVILGAVTPSPGTPGEGGGEGSAVSRAPLRTTRTLNLPSPGVPGEGKHEVVITGVGVVAPGVVGNEALIARLSTAVPWSNLTGSLPEAALEGLLNARRVRRLSDYVKLQLAAATLAVRHAGITDLAEYANQFSAILGSNQGSVNYSYDYYSRIVKEGLIGANPMLFAEGVPNAGAAHISLMLGLKGACQSIIGTRTAGIDALNLATARIASGAWDRAIIGAGEEDYDIVRRAYQHCGMAARGEPSTAFGGGAGFVTGAGAAAIVLESRQAADARGAKPLARIDSTAFAHGDRAHLANAAARVLRELGSAENVLSSAAGTWMDRAEAIAMRQSGTKTAGAIYGHIAESFSATALIGLSATLLTRRLPSVMGDRTELSGIDASDGSQTIDSFSTLCTDLTGVVSGVRLTIL